jgi:spoIIIJ-associated protein
MRFEAKTEADAVERAAKALGCPAAEVKYRVVRDEKSFWGGKIVEIDVDVPASPATAAPVETKEAFFDDPVIVKELEAPGDTRAAAGPPLHRRSAEPVLDEEAFAAVESTLAELLSVAGFLLETRRKTSPDEMVIELIGDDVEPLLANKGEGLNGLEILTGRIASRRLGRPVYPIIDAEGFRAHQRESLEELAHRSADEVKRTRRPTLLPPLSPGERRLVHLALAEDPEVETESEGDGFLKRVAVKLKAR